MTSEAPIRTLFLDVGGVLLTNGWDHHARRRAVAEFNLEWDEFEPRHQLNFATYEEGKLTVEEYLNRTVFYAKRAFSREEFWDFMTAQSQPYPEMLDLAARLKSRYGLKIAVVSNEARELNEYRIRTFKLDALVDCFVSSCFVHFRKPDLDIFRLALDIAQTPPERIVYIENTPLFVQVAEGLGIRSILHTDCESTRRELAALGLCPDGGATHDSR
jgi:HAD superfamily hydrolase (TIGR01509 family)